MRTYYIILTCLLLLLGKVAEGQGHNLYFSKYVEGSGYDKALEIYNPTNNTIILGYYRIEVDTDGKGFDSNQRVSKFNLTGKLAPKSSLLLVREVSGNEELKFLADTTIRSNVLNFNGNEQIRLLEIEDDREDRYRVIDQIGFSGATYNMKDMLLVRAEHTAPNDGNPGTSVSSQWSRHNKDELSLLKLAPGSANLGGTVDKTKTVGAIGGASSVSRSGAAIYSIPISILPGIKGLEPQLSIVYNNQSWNGILGKAWNLVGLSSIARVSSNIYNDGENRSIKFDKKDRLALDGNRLILESGKYWEEGAEYRTEIASFSKITTVREGALTRYIVETKDGRIMEYDASYSSIYLLRKVSDKNGNVIEYNYKQGSNHFCTYIDNIQYNGNTIEFVYGSNRNPVKKYFLDSKITIDKILTNINIKRGSSLIYGYKLDYYKNDYKNTDELVKVTKYNGSQDEINPTNIIWKHNNSLDFETVSVNNPIGNPTFKDQRYTSVDYNGDGLDDLIGRFEGDNGRDILQIYLNNTKLGGNISFTSSSANRFEINRGSIHTSSFEIDCGTVSADVRGNGKYNIFTPQWRGDNEKSLLYFHSIDRIMDDPVTEKSFPIDKKPMFTITDFNMNGKHEFFCLSNEPNGLNEYDVEILELSSIEGAFKSSSFELSLPQSLTFTNPTLLYGDFNCNGISEVLTFTSGGIYGFEKRDGTDDLDRFYLDELVIEEDAIIKQGDLNGDGTPDIIISRADGNKNMKFLYSNPTGLKEPGAQYISSLNDNRTHKDDDMNNIIVVDFNKDGKDDIITFQADFDRKTSWGSSYYRFNKMIITHYKATNSGFSKIEYVNAGSETYSHAKYFMSGDFNGDGNNDILNYGYQYLKTYNSTIKWRSLTNFNNDFDSELVKSITDGFGNNTTYSYRPLTDKGCVSNSFAENEISAKNWRSKGVISLRTPLYVVSDLMSSNGIGGNTLIKYKYDSPLFHNHGRGFLGFLRAESDNTNLDIKEKRYYKLNDFYIINRLWKTETFNRNQLVSRVESVDGFKGFLNKGFYVYIANSTQNDIVNGIEVTTANVYDDFGNLKEQTANYGSDVTVSLANTFTSKGSWCDSKVKTSTKTTTYKGESPFSINSSYTYYDNGNLETSNSNGVTTRYLYYDAYRNAKTVTLIASGAESRSTKYEYDDKFHRFVKKVTNPLNQTESFTYNNWGKVLTITDIAGNVSSNKYDAWGVLTETTHPNNKKSTNSIHWAENNNYNALYYTKTINEGAPYEKVLYDQKGRVVGQGNRI